MHRSSNSRGRWRSSRRSWSETDADLVKVGEDVSEQLNVERARFFVRRHIRPPYRACESVTVALVTPAMIDDGLAAPGLLAWVAAGKYLDHLPL